MVFFGFGVVSLHGDRCKNTVKLLASPRFFTVDPMRLKIGEPIQYHGFLSLQPMFPSKPFDNFPQRVDAQKV